MTETATNTELEAFRTQVRNVAIRVAAEQDWCDSGLNDVLEELGLAPKKTFWIRVRVNGAQTVRLPVNDAQSEDEARAKLTAEPMTLKARLSDAGYWFGDGPVEVELIEPPAQPAADSGVPLPGQGCPEDGVWYATSVVSGGPNQCRVNAYMHDELYCTRPLGHDADWHVASGKNAGVLEVWPAKEGDVRTTPTPEMPAED